LEVVRESVHPDVLSWNNPKFLNRWFCYCWLFLVNFKLVLEE
jgi:hypothetical protein